MVPEELHETFRYLRCLLDSSQSRRLVLVDSHGEVMRLQEWAHLAGNTAFGAGGCSVDTTGSDGAYPAMTSASYRLGADALPGGMTTRGDVSVCKGRSDGRDMSWHLS